MARKTEFQRFVEKIRPPKDPVRDCWLWTGYANERGYGRFWVRNAVGRRGRMVRAHRFSLETYTLRPVPDTMDVDHLCRNRGCVNPLHLEIVSHRENVSRGALGALHPTKTSRFVGVCRKRNKWIAQATLGGTTRLIGSFNTEEDARDAYLKFIGGE